MIRAKKVFFGIVISCSVLLCACTPNGSVQVDIAEREVQLTMGELKELEYSVTPEEGYEVQWESSDSAVVSVYRGRLYGEGSGNAQVTAYVLVGKEKIADSVQVTVLAQYNETIAEKTMYLGDEALDISLPGSEIGGFSYTVKVYGPSGDLVENAVVNDRFSVNEAGRYKLEYTVSGNGIAETQVTGYVNVYAKGEYGVLDNFKTLSTVRMTSTPEATAEFSDFVPDGTDADRKSVKLNNVSRFDGFRIVLTDTNLLPELNRYGDDDMISVTMYYQTTVETNTSARAVDFALFKNFNNNYDFKITEQLVPNRWIEYRFPVRYYRESALGQAQLFLGMTFNSYNVDDKIESVYLYEVKVVRADIYSFVDETVSLALPSMGISGMDYSFTVTRSDEMETIFEGDSVNSVFVPEAEGEYTVNYEVSGNEIVNTAFKQIVIVYPKLSYGNVNALYSDKSVITNASSQNVDATLAAENLPVGFERDTLIKVYNPTATVMAHGNVKFLLNLNFRALIDDGMANEDYFTVRFFVKNLDGTSSGNRWGQLYYFYNSAFNYLDASRQKFNVRYDNNRWTEYDVSVATIRQMHDMNKGKGGNVYLGIELNPSDAPQVECVYFADVSYHKADLSDYIGNEIDLSLAGLGDIVSYRYTVLNEEMETVAEGTQAEPFFTFTEKGRYTVRYTDIEGNTLKSGSEYTANCFIKEKPSYGMTDYSVLSTPIWTTGGADAEKGVCVSGDLGLTDYKGNGFIRFYADGAPLHTGNARYGLNVDFAGLLDDNMSDDDFFTVRLHAKSAETTSQDRWGELIWCYDDTFNYNSELSGVKNTYRVKNNDWTVYRFSVGDIRRLSEAFYQSNGNRGVYFSITINPKDNPAVTELYFDEIIAFHVADKTAVAGEPADVSLPEVGVKILYSVEIRNAANETVFRGTQNDAVFIFKAGEYTAEYVINGIGLRETVLIIKIHVEE